MKQKFYSILLLAAFMLVVAHGIIPHHHHKADECISSIEEHHHTNDYECAHISSPKELHETDCEHLLIVNKDNGCQIPAYACIVNDFDGVRQSYNSSKSAGAKKLSLAQFIFTNIFSFCHLSSDRYPLGIELFAECECLVNIPSLRGPPVLS